MRWSLLRERRSAAASVEGPTSKLMAPDGSGNGSSNINSTSCDNSSSTKQKSSVIHHDPRVSDIKENAQQAQPHSQQQRGAAPTPFTTINGEMLGELLEAASCPHLPPVSFSCSSSASAPSDSCRSPATSLEAARGAQTGRSSTSSGPGTPHACAASSLCSSSTVSSSAGALDTVLCGGVDGKAGSGQSNGGSIPPQGSSQSVASLPGVEEVSNQQDDDYIDDRTFQANGLGTASASSFLSQLDISLAAASAEFLADGRQLPTLQPPLLSAEETIPQGFISYYQQQPPQQQQQQQQQQQERLPLEPPPTSQSEPQQQQQQQQQRRWMVPGKPQLFSSPSRCQQQQRDCEVAALDAAIAAVDAAVVEAAFAGAACQPAPVTGTAEASSMTGGNGCSPARASSGRRSVSSACAYDGSRGDRVKEGLVLVSGAAMIPHVAKMYTGGEDAYFISDAGHGSLAVADGVSAWAHDGIDPGEYSRTLVQNIREVIESPPYVNQTSSIFEGRSVLRRAQMATFKPGSATVVLASLRPRTASHAPRRRGLGTQAAGNVAGSANGNSSDAAALSCGAGVLARGGSGGRKRCSVWGCDVRGAGDQRPCGLQQCEDGITSGEEAAKQLPAAPGTSPDSPPPSPASAGAAAEVMLVGSASALSAPACSSTADSRGGVGGSIGSPATPAGKGGSLPNAPADFGCGMVFDLHLSNLGDCGVKVIRESRIILSTEPQQHDFNLPFQMSHPRLFPETDIAGSADRYVVEVKEGDVIVAASDGVFDNLWDDQLLTVLSGVMGHHMTNGSTSSSTPRRSSGAAKQPKQGHRRSLSSAFSGWGFAAGRSSAARGKAAAGAAAAGGGSAAAGTDARDCSKDMVAGLGAEGAEAGEGDEGGLKRSDSAPPDVLSSCNGGVSDQGEVPVPCASISTLDHASEASLPSANPQRSSSSPLTPHAAADTSDRASKRPQSPESSGNGASAAVPALSKRPESPASSSSSKGQSAAVLAQRAADALVRAAMKNAQDESFRSPWSVAAGRQGLFARLFAKGGKMDDCTCVVAIVRDVRRA